MRSKTRTDAGAPNRRAGTKRLRERKVEPPSGASTSVSDRAYELIKRDILVCEIKPGAQISEQQLVQRYAIGKAPIRRALSQLVRDGLVQVYSRKGHVVSPITLKDAHDIVDVFEVLVTASVKMVKEVSDLGELESCKEEMHRFVSSPTRESAQEFLRVLARFWYSLASASRNEFLMKMVRQVMEQMERLSNVSLALGGYDPNEAEAEIRQCIALCDHVVDYVEGKRQDITSEIEVYAKNLRTAINNSIVQSRPVREMNLTL